MTVQLDGEQVFTKGMARVFKSEVVECPDCVFEFSSKHTLSDSEGLYICPCCKEADLEVQVNYYREVIGEALKIARLNALSNPQCSDIEVILSKVMDDL